MRLELWQHRPTRDRFVVLLGATGAQQADGPLTDGDISAIQQNMANIRWSRSCAEWIVSHARDFVSVWPPQPASDAIPLSASCIQTHLVQAE
jgi:hypothetical protein